MTAPAPDHWLASTSEGLYCIPGGFHIDPRRGVERAVVTHGHSDHARPGSAHVLATAETLAIMRHRLGEEAGRSLQAAAYGEVVRIGEVSVRLAPAGHVLGSAQVVMEYRGSRVVVSGDYKRRPDPTCPPFEVVPCDVFVTEATFGLPVFRHPPAEREIDKILHAQHLYPERAVLVGTYALGKCQRVILLLRQRGFDGPVWLHGALTAMCALYAEFGFDFGDLRPATGVPREALKGQIVLAPPGAIADLWARRLPDPVAGMASGWMGVRQRARQRGVELPIVISDHADWDELTRTLDEVEAPEIWVTHGREEGLIRHATLAGRRARALSLIGFDEDEG